MKKLLVICLVIVGAINLLPVFGVLSAERIESAYGIELLSSDAVILMRHRALVLGMLGAFVIYSAFVQRHQRIALTMISISMFGFVFLALANYPINNALQNILLVDFIGISFTAIAIFAKFKISGKAD